MTATPVIDRDEPKRKRRWKRPFWIGLATAFVAVVVVILVVFQPQKLLFDDHVDEAVPVAAGPEPAVDTNTNTDAVSPPAAEPVTLLSGSFISRDHGTSGVADVLDVGGTSYLRIEDLDTDNGPDLFVYLTANVADGPEGAFDDDFVDLGGLKGNVGNQNYEIPPGTDLTRYSTVVIWCDRFDSAFGAANLA